MNKYTIIGLLTLSLAAAAPALARDDHRSYDKHRNYSSHQNHNKHSGKHVQKYEKKYYSAHKGHKSKHHNKSYYNENRYDRNHYKSRHYKRNLDRHYRHNNRHYYSHSYSRRHHGYNHYSRHGNYVDDYFAILGGTILVNELLYHSHEHH